MELKEYSLSDFSPLKRQEQDNRDGLFKVKNYGFMLNENHQIQKAFCILASPSRLFNIFLQPFKYDIQKLKCLFGVWSFKQCQKGSSAQMIFQRELLAM